MSPILKCLLGLLIVLCFVQFIEMARIPRDDTSAKDLGSILGEFGSSLNKIIQENTEELKKFTESGTQQLNQLFKSFQKPGEKISQ